MWAARTTDGRVIGTVSLAFSDKPNSRHRAELVKLMVHRDGRGRVGLGRTLLTTAGRVRKRRIAARAIRRPRTQAIRSLRSRATTKRAPS